MTYFKLSRGGTDVFECVGCPEADDIVCRDARRCADERGGYLCCATEYSFSKMLHMVKVTRDGMCELTEEGV